jgi:tRNA A37 threonylcarbamoyltransferase TsaD
MAPDYAIQLMGVNHIVNHVIYVIIITSAQTPSDVLMGSGPNELTHARDDAIINS